MSYRPNFKCDYISKAVPIEETALPSTGSREQSIVFCTVTATPYLALAFIGSKEPWGREAQHPYLVPTLIMPVRHTSKPHTPSWCIVVNYAFG